MADNSSLTQSSLIQSTIFTNTQPFVEINKTLTAKLQSQEKFKNFNKWLNDRGVKQQGVLYPTAFGEQGLVGVSSTEFIPAKTAFISIPNSVIISFEKAKQSELKVIYKASKELFDPKENDEAGMNVLTVFLMNEKIKNKKSYWCEYLNIIEDMSTILGWGEQDIQLIPDPYIRKQANELIEQVEELWNELKVVLVQFPQFFAKANLTKELFYWAYDIVLSRCLGYSEQGTCIIPYADCLNHDKYHASYMYVHKGYERTPSIKHPSYRIKKNVVNISQVDKELVNENNSNQLNKKQNQQQIFKYIKSYKEDIQISPSQTRNDLYPEVLTINQERMLTDDPPVQIWDLPFFTTSEEEDNDDEEDEEVTKKEREITTVKLRESSTMREALEKVRRYEEKLRNQPKKTSEEEAQAKEKQFKADEEYQKQQLIKQMAKIQSDRDQELKQKQKQIQQKGQNQGEDDDSDENNEKEKVNELNDLNEDDNQWYEYNSEDIYFVFASDRSIDKDQQVYNFYGRRTNRYLLTWYGFAYNKNHYDSYEFRLFAHRKGEEITENSVKSLLYCDYVSVAEWDSELKLSDGKSLPPSVLSKGFQLKDSMLCEDILNYIRVIKMNTYNGLDRDSIMLTRPKSINFELRCIESVMIILQELLYTKIKEQKQIDVDKFKSKLHKQYSLDLQIGHLAAIKRQLSLFGIAKEILTGMAKSKQQFNELYSQTFPQYETEAQYIINRSYLRNYLKALYEGIVKSSVNNKK